MYRFLLYKSLNDLVGYCKVYSSNVLSENILKLESGQNQKFHSLACQVRTAAH